MDELGNVSELKCSMENKIKWKMKNESHTKRGGFQVRRSGINTSNILYRIIESNKV